MDYASLSNYDNKPTRENWYMTPTGSVYELNNTALSGIGPHSGPKQSIKKTITTGAKVGISLLIVLALIMLVVAMMGGDNKLESSQFYF